MRETEGESMALEVTPVYRNLRTRVTFLGLEAEDLFAILALAVVANILGRFLEREMFGLPMNVVLQYVVPVLSIPALMLFKYGKPRGYIRDLIVWDLLFVNFVWGLMNLLPVYPLDGGQISREIFVERDAGRGIVRSLWLSFIVAALVAVYALFAWNRIFVPIMFGLLAFGSYQMLQAYTGRGSGVGW